MNCQQHLFLLFCSKNIGAAFVEYALRRPSTFLALMASRRADVISQFRS